MSNEKVDSYCKITACNWLQGFDFGYVGYCSFETKSNTEHECSMGSWSRDWTVLESI